MTTIFPPLFIGATELLLIGGIALLLFGGKKLPEMMRGLGQGVREFKKGVNEGNFAMKDEDEISDESERNHAENSQSGMKHERGK